MMIRIALLGLLISSFLTCGLQAQSTSRGDSNPSYGSSNRSNGSSSAMKAKERMMAKEISTVAKKIQRGQLAAITLDRTQKNTLEELVGKNFQQISTFNNQVGQMIPADMVKKLQRFYNAAKKKGANEVEAMQASMTKIGLEDATQEKILMISAKTMEIENMIAAGLAESLNDEQKATLMATMKKQSETEMASAEGSGTKDKMMEGESATKVNVAAETMEMKEETGSQSR